MCTDSLQGSQHGWDQRSCCVCKNGNQKYDPDSRTYLDAVQNPDFQIISCRILAISQGFSRINLDLPGYSMENWPN